MTSPKERETIDLDTTLGKIRGIVVTAPNGKRIAKFLGIPYAKQPIAKLRFKPLEPLELPLGTVEKPFEAVELGACSIQDKNVPTATELSLISEKCIFINLFVPVYGLDTPKPVFFNIHCGAFYLFSGNEPVYDMTNFAAIHNVVGVSFNYRLGLLGFLSLPPVIEDNLGLKDQQFALKWVHQHIKSFGGDAEKITIYGCSAGGASCHFHTVNEESSPLFTRAILSSGAINPTWSCLTPEQQQKRVQWVLRKLECPKNLTKQETLEFLQSLSEHAFYHVITKDNILKRGPLPVNTFITQNGSKVPLNRKPILMGVTAEEGNLYPEIVFPRNDGAESFTKARANVAKIVSEKFFLEPMRETTAEILKSDDYPLYCFLFDYETETRGKDICTEQYHQKWIGKFHSLDIMFFMGHCCENSKSLPETTEKDVIVNSAIAAMVRKFMTENVNEIELPLYKADSQKISRITEEGLKEDEFDFKPYKDKLLTTKASFAGMMLTLLPNKF